MQKTAFCLISVLGEADRIRDDIEVKLNQLN